MTRPPGFVIAIDGPAASGKGTLGRMLARDYGLAYLDTGLLYRAVGYIASRPPFTLDRAEEVARHSMPETLEHPGYRTREASEAASKVAADPGVRAALFDFQRRFSEDPRGAVIDGRDIGTVICPEAPAKLYVTASPQARAERRWKQLNAEGDPATLQDVLDDIRRRDARDSGREAAPMRPAADADLLDTTEMTIEQAADAARRIVEAARARWDKTRQG